MKKILFVLTATLFLSIYGQASDIYFYHLGIRDGLSQVNVLSIYQDEFGAMWFGTTEGVNRYNGAGFESFRPSDTDEGLTQNIIYSIQGNKKGMMYINADSDLIGYNLYTQKFKNIQEGGVNAIHYKDSSLWVAVNNDIRVYDELLSEYKLFTTLGDDVQSITSIYVSSKDDLWIGTKEGLISYSMKNSEEREYLLKGEYIHNIYEGRSNNIWVGTNGGGLYLISPEGTITNFRNKGTENSISNNRVRSILEDGEGNLWIGTFLGLNKYNPKSGEWKSYVNRDNIAHSISHSSVFSIYQDRQGSVWVGTYFGGVNYFNTETDVFRYYGASSTMSNYLSFPIVSKMTEDDHNTLWICTEGGGLNSLDLATHHLSQHILNPDNKFSEFNNLKCIWYRKGENKLYIGTHQGGLAIFDIKTKQVKHILSDATKSHSLPNNTINEMQYYKGMLILLTQAGLVKMDVDNNEVYPFSDNPFISGVLSTMDFNTFLIDSKDRLWVQKDMGQLVSVDLNTDKINTYRHNNKENSIAKFRINDIFETKDGQIFFATSGAGIFLFNEDTGDFTTYTAEMDGLTSNYCYSISELPSGKLILLFSKGFSFFDPKDPQSIQFKSSLNFPLVGFNIGSSIYVTEDDQVFVGGINGLVSFYESNLSLNHGNHDIYFDKLLVNNKIVAPKDNTGILQEALALTKEITLKPHQNSITIEFASSNYLQSAVRDYQYRLKGFDDGWVTADGSRQIIYTNLNPGKYVLEIRDMSDKEDGVDVHCLLINVDPPFYKTNLAYFFYFLGLIFLFIGIVRFYAWRTKIQTRLEFEQKDKERIEELNNIKFRFFTNISHEFRTPLTLIIGQIDLMLNRTDLKEDLHNRISKISKNAKHLQALITELLDFRKQEQGFNKLAAQKIDFVSYISDIYDSFEGYAQRKSVNFTLDSEYEALDAFIDPKLFQKAVYNLLSNAFKFTPRGGNICINISSDDKRIYLKVFDNGEGIPAESLRKVFDRFYQLEYRSSSLSLGTGIGLALTKEIVCAHKGEIDVESKLNEGSCFTITLLKGKTQFSEEELSQKEKTYRKLEIEEETLSELHQKTAFVEAENTEGGIKTDRPTVLFVEDNEELIDLLTESFSLDYNVCRAFDGEMGWELLLSTQPDIVVSDIMMPKLTGKELCYRIKNNIDTSHIPVVLLTAQTSDNEILDGLMFGADAYMTKPFNMQILKQTCANLLKNKRAMYDNVISKENEQDEYDGIAESDRILIEKAVEIIKKNFNNKDFDMNQLGLELGMGRSKLYTKLKEVTGFTPNEFTLNVKLKEAALLLEKRSEMNISDIAFHLGFSSPKYFTKCFKTFYQITPLDWRRKSMRDT